MVSCVQSGATIAKIAFDLSVRRVSVLLFTITLFAFVTTVGAQGPYEDEKTPAGWAWKQIRSDQIADFGTRCGKLDPRAKDGWDDRCRRISPQFLIDVLTMPNLRDQVPRHQVRLRGVWVDGTIDLADREITSEVWIDASRIEGTLLLARSRWVRPLSLTGSTLTGDFAAGGMHSESFIVLGNHAVLNGKVDLHGANIGGNLILESSEFAGTLNANSLSVAGSLAMYNHATFGDTVELIDAKIGGDLSMQTSRFVKPVIAGSLTVGRRLFMHEGAAFNGDLNLRGAKIGDALEMASSLFAGVVDGEAMTIAGTLFMNNHARFGGEVILRGATISRDLITDTSSFDGAINANRLNVAGSLLMRGVRVAGGVDLVTAKIGQNLEMQTSSFFSKLDAGSVSVAGGLLMHDQSNFGGDVVLTGANLGSLGADTSHFAGTLSANQSTVANGLVMRKVKVDGDVNLASAKVGAGLEMQSSLFLRQVDARSINVLGTVLMNDDAKFNGEVLLTSAKIIGNLDMSTSTFLEAVLADTLNVGDNLFMNQAKFDGEVDLVASKIDGVLDARGTSAALFNLSGAVAKELLLSEIRWSCINGKPPGDATASGQLAGIIPAPTHWRLGDPVWREVRCAGADGPISPMIILRNAHVDAIQDSIDAWPPFVDLEGFRYDRLGGVLGGVEGIGRNDMRQRSTGEWIDWLARDRTFSPQPYTQLAAILIAAGRRSTAEIIQFAGRERERSEAWTHADLGSWAWLTILACVAGYGIGLYTFRVLWWTLLFTVVGFAFLCFSRNARAHSVLWRLGASLHRLLPIVKLSKEFDDFFDNPSTNSDWPRNLNRIQVGYFALHAIIGWVLGLILLAAMGGLTQKG